MLNWRLISLFLLLTACSQPAVASNGTPDRPLKHAHVLLTTSEGKRHVVDTEVAVAPADRERGLMNRRTMKEDAGMIFVFDDERVQTFWMKNTLIPLDMIFIGSDGVIVGIVANAEPETLTRRSVG